MSRTAPRVGTRTVDSLPRQTQHKPAARQLPLTLAWQHYRQQLPGALLMWTPTLCHPPTMPDMQPDAVSFEMIRRITTAISDLGVLQ